MRLVHRLRTLFGAALLVAMGGACLLDGSAGDLVAGEADDWRHASQAPTMAAASETTAPYLCALRRAPAALLSVPRPLQDAVAAPALLAEPRPTREPRALVIAPLAPRAPPPG